MERVAIDAQVRHVGVQEERRAEPDGQMHRQLVGLRMRRVGLVRVAGGHVEDMAGAERGQALITPQ